MRLLCSASRPPPTHGPNQPHTQSYAFVVRAISTVYNYDYLWDHIFYMDGTMEVKVMAFGYVLAQHLASNALLTQWLVCATAPFHVNGWYAQLHSFTSRAHGGRSKSHDPTWPRPRPLPTSCAPPRQPQLSRVFSIRTRTLHTHHLPVYPTPTPHPQRTAYPCVSLHAVTCKLCATTLPTATLCRPTLAAPSTTTWDTGRCGAGAGAVVCNTTGAVCNTTGKKNRCSSV